MSHVPSQPMSIPSPTGVIGRNSSLQLDTRNSMGTTRHVFEGLLPRGHLASSSCRLMPTLWKQTAESYNTNSPLCKEVFDMKSSVSNKTNFSSKLYDAKSKEPGLGPEFRERPEPNDFQYWKVNFKTE